MNMKKIILSLAIIALTIILWFHWGGISNDFGTFVLALSAVFALNVVDTECSEKKSEKTERNQ